MEKAGISDLETGINQTETGLSGLTQTETSLSALNQTETGLSGTNQTETGLSGTNQTETLNELNQTETGLSRPNQTETGLIGETQTEIDVMGEVQTETCFAGDETMDILRAEPIIVFDIEPTKPNEPNDTNINDSTEATNPPETNYTTTDDANEDDLHVKDKSSDALETMKNTDDDDHHHNEENLLNKDLSKQRHRPEKRLSKIVQYRTRSYESSERNQVEKVGVYRSSSFRRAGVEDGWRRGGEDGRSRGDEEAEDEREGLSRRGSLRRRDGSMDRRWEGQLKPDSISRAGRGFNPGRLNCSYWEDRVRTENSLPPKTPPPKRKLRNPENHPETRVHLEREEVELNNERKGGVRKEEDEKLKEVSRMNQETNFKHEEEVYLTNFENCEESFQNEKMEENKEEEKTKEKLFLKSNSEQRMETREEKEKESIYCTDIRIEDNKEEIFFERIEFGTEKIEKEKSEKIESENVMSNDNIEMKTETNPENLESTHVIQNNVSEELENIENFLIENSADFPIIKPENSFDLCTGRITPGPDSDTRINIPEDGKLIGAERLGENAESAQNTEKDEKFREIFENESKDRNSDVLRPELNISVLLQPVNQNRIFRPPSLSPVKNGELLAAAQAVTTQFSQALDPVTNPDIRRTLSRPASSRSTREGTHQVPEIVPFEPDQLYSSCRRIEMVSLEDPVLPVSDKPKTNLPSEVSCLSPPPPTPPPIPDPTLTSTVLQELPPPPPPSHQTNLEQAETWSLPSPPPEARSERTPPRPAPPRPTSPPAPIPPRRSTSHSWIKGGFESPSTPRRGVSLTALTHIGLSSPSTPADFISALESLIPTPSASTPTLIDEPESISVSLGSTITTSSSTSTLTGFFPNPPGSVSTLGRMSSTPTPGRITPSSGLVLTPTPACFTSNPTSSTVEPSSTPIPITVQTSSTPTPSSARPSATDILSSGRPSSTPTPSSARPPSTPTSSSARSSSTPTPSSARLLSSSTTFEEGIISTPTPIKEGLSSTPPPIKEGTSSTPTPLKEGLLSTPPPIKEGTSSTPTPLKEGLSSTPPPIKEGTSSTPNPIEEGTSSTPTPIKERTISTPPPPIKEGASSTPTPIKEKTPSTPTPIKERTSSTPTSYSTQLTSTPPARRRLIVRAVRTPSPSPPPPTRALRTTSPSPTPPSLPSTLPPPLPTLLIKTEEMMCSLPPEPIPGFGIYPSGVYKAVPVNVDENMEDDIAYSYGTSSENVFKLQEEKIIEATRRNFLTNMLVSTELNLQGLDENSIRIKLAKQQEEAERIVLKKKEEEERKRREADMKRKKEEAEALKRAAELKKKRDEEDKILQKEIQLRRFRKEEERKKIAEEQRIREEEKKFQYERERKMREQLEKMRQVMFEKEQTVENERREKLEEFHKKKEDHLSKIGSRSPSIASLDFLGARSPSGAMVSSPLPSFRSSPDLNSNNKFKNSKISNVTSTHSSASVVKSSASVIQSSASINQSSASVNQSSIGEITSSTDVNPSSSSLNQSSARENQSSIENNTLLNLTNPTSDINPVQVFKDESNTQTETSLSTEKKQNLKNLELYCPENYKPAKKDINLITNPASSEPKLSPKTSPWMTRSQQPSPITISENVRFTNKYLLKSRKPDINANIFINNEDHQIHSSLRWKDVRTGLVKDRATSYLKPDNYKSFSPLNSPRIQKRMIITGSDLEDKEHLTQPNHVYSSNNKYVDGPVPWRKEERKKDVKSPILNLLNVSVSGSGIHPQDEIIQVVDQRSQIREEHIEKVLAPGTSQISIPELNPKPKGGTEAVANLDETLRLLQAHVSSLESTQHPSINQSTDDIIESAATTVKDTAGAVKNLAQSLLRVITPELGKEGRKDGESSQNLQNIKDAIAGRGSLTLGGIGELEGDQGTLRRFARGRPRMVVAEEEDEEEDSIGYEDDFSIGIDLPLQLDVTSGNVTPIPTTGELEELSSIEETTVIEFIPQDIPRDNPPHNLPIITGPRIPVEMKDNVVEDQNPDTRPTSRSTPLKSLLKKPSVDVDSDSDSDSNEGNISPKKVHFSEIDQIKLMSQDSLSSMAASENQDFLPVQLCTTVLTSTPVPSVVRIITSRPAVPETNGNVYIENQVPTS